MSRAMPRSIASPPAFSTISSVAGRLEAVIWSGPTGSPAPHQLVARGEDGDPRPAADGKRAVAHGGGQREMARVQALAGLQQHVAGAEVETGRRGCGGRGGPLP